MRQWLTMMMFLVLVIATGCGTFFGDDDDDVISEECWVEIYEDANFIRDTPWTRIQGPSEFKNLDEVAGRNWNDKISSMRVGPDAIVQIYEHAGFRGEVREYEFDRFVDDLADDQMNDRVSAIKIRCR